MEDVGGLQDAVLSLADQIDQHGLPTDTILALFEDFFEVLGRISALRDIDTDDEVVNTLTLIEHRVRVEDVQEVGSSTGAGRPPLDIPGDMLAPYVLSGLSTREIADLFGVSSRTIQRRSVEEGLR